MKKFKLIPLITIFFLISCGESEETRTAKQKMKEEIAEKEEEKQFKLVRLERNQLENEIYTCELTINTSLNETLPANDKKLITTDGHR